MLWEIEIRPRPERSDRDALRLLADVRDLGCASIHVVETARLFLIEGGLSREEAEEVAARLLTDPVVETHAVSLTSNSSETPPVRTPNTQHPAPSTQTVNVLFKPGVTDNVGNTAKRAIQDLGLAVDAVATARRYWFNADATDADVQKVATKLLANDAIEHVVYGPLALESIAPGGRYEFELVTVPIRDMDDDGLARLSTAGQLYLNLEEMRTIRAHFHSLERDPTDAELETVAQTWSEHCSHKTLAGRIRYTDGEQEILFDNMLKETIFAATVEIREKLGDDDWCVSVFKDNAGVVRFDEKQHVCFKVETHNHPSALEPYGGANTGLGGVIRDPLGTGLGGRPVLSTDVFCFAPPDVPHDELPPGVLHPKAVMKGVVAGVRDYGNRMGIPTVNGAVYFDRRYLGNPLVYCGNAAMIPVGKVEKEVRPGDLIVAVGGRTGRDGIHGATFSSAELTEESETLSGGAVQIGNAITEKMLLDVILEARDRGLYTAITDCGAGGFSSAVGEMGEHTGAEVHLDRAPLKYSGLSYTEIWISEAQERMVLAVPPEHWDEFESICTAEGVEATAIGRFTDDGRLVLKYEDQVVADVSMEFLHNGRPPIVREARFVQRPEGESRVSGVGRQRSEVKVQTSESNIDDHRSPITDHRAPSTQHPTPETPQSDHNQTLERILSSLNVCSKEWIIRQYDHEVQAGSVVKPLVGVRRDGPSDAAVVRPDLSSNRGLVVACGMNPRYGDLDPYWMAASAIDEAIRNCVAVGADPARIAILDNFCWGNTDRPETLGSLVRAALGCRDTAVAYGTPFISGKDSLFNEFSWIDADGDKQTVSIPPSLLISALGQIADVNKAVTMDLKEAGNLIYLVGRTKNELGGSHHHLVNELEGGSVPRINAAVASASFNALHEAITRGLVRSCHDLSEGGLAVAAAEMAFAGELGLRLTLSDAGGENADGDEPLTDVAALFSESNSRFLVEVPVDAHVEFESLFECTTDDDARPPAQLGSVASEDRVALHNAAGELLIDRPWSLLKNHWQQPLGWD